MKIRSKNFYVPEKGETNSGEQLTIPNEGLSLKDLLYKHTIDYQGYERPGSFNEDPDHDDIDVVQTSQLDLTEIEDIKQFNNQKIEKTKQKLSFLKKQKEETQNPTPLPATE